MKPKQEDPKEMVGGCCVCSDENGWAENPLVYCDGQGCNVAVHQACYGIVTVPTGSWFCRKCESQERAARVDSLQVKRKSRVGENLRKGLEVAVHGTDDFEAMMPLSGYGSKHTYSGEVAGTHHSRCELCPSKDGALKRTDSGGWAHVVCALYIPEVRFGNVTTMEPIMLQLIPQERFNKSCYLCDEAQRGSKATIGACMQCNRAGCKNHFHVTCAQAMGLLCEEAGNYLDNVKYCGYCQYHYNKLRRGSHVKTIPPYRPVAHDSVSSDEDKGSADSKDPKLKKRSSSKSSPVHDGGSSGSAKQQLTREVKVNLGELPPVGSSTKSGSVSLGGESSSSQDPSASSGFSLGVVSNSAIVGGLSMGKSDSKSNDGTKPQHSNPSHVSNAASAASSPSTTPSMKHSSSSFSTSNLSAGGPSPDSKTITVTSVTFPTSSATSNLSLTSVNLSNSSLASAVTATESISTPVGATSATSQPSATVPSATYTTTSSSSSSMSSGSELLTSVVSSVSTIVSLPNTKIRTVTSGGGASSAHSGTSSHHHHSQSTMSVSLSSGEKDKHHRSKMRRNGSRSNNGAASSVPENDGDAMGGGVENHSSSKEGVLTICEERNLSSVEREKSSSGKGQQSYSEETKLNVQYTPNVSSNQGHKTESFHSSVGMDTALVEPIKRSRSSSQDRGRRSKRGSSGGGGSVSKRGRVSLSSKENAKENRESEASSPESMSSEVPPKRGRTMKHEVKEQKEPSAQNSVITNGVAANTLLLGNQINPASAVAQKMTDTLNSELEAHSIYKDEEKVNTSLIGPALPGKRETSTPGILNSTQPPPLPQNLEQLLERQWEQGSQFLMEQAQHFDIASLLSCLHQLRQENVRLEETVNNLVARRDHLLAVNARLSVPLGSSSSSQGNAAVAPTSQQPTAASSSTSSSSSVSSCSSSSVSITPAVSSALVGSVGGHVAQMSHSSSAAALLPSRGHGQQQRHPSGGGSSHPTMSNTSSNLSGRGASPHDRKAPHQGPLENGLGEPEYRYRSPGTDHQHRQQSPMLPPGAQPSPTSMRQSPASSGYHSGSSPHTHTGVPSLSPSGVNHPPAPPHTLVAHGHPPGMPSSSHGGGPTHSVALSRAPTDHSRAELVRLSSTQPHSNPGVGYPVYQMVSPPVPGPHHSPVGMSQHPPHSQVVRREVESGRSSHSLEKR